MPPLPRARGGFVLCWLKNGNWFQTMTHVNLSPSPGWIFSACTRLPVEHAQISHVFGGKLRDKRVKVVQGDQRPDRWDNKYENRRKQEGDKEQDQQEQGGQDVLKRVAHR